MSKINIRLSHRNILFLTFAFVMTATLSFLAVHNMTKTDAASFQAGDIISDAVMANYNSMSESDINNFMHSKNSCNDTNLSKRNRYPNLTYQIRDGHFVCLADQTFNSQSAAHIIWQAAQDYKINPQVLLVLLQKEQSLITDTWPDDQQIRKATGYACTDSAPCDPSKSGFENQIRKAADLYRTVLDGGWTNYPVGNNYVQYNPNSGCGGSTVYIANRATSSLYRYTPYQPNAAALSGGGDSCSAYGNLNFWKYFTNWFGDTHAITDIRSVYLPEGTYTLNTTANKTLGFTSTENGSAAQVSDNNGSDLTKFTLERDDYQYFKLRNVASGRYLDVNGADTLNGTQVQLWDGNDSCAQRWSIEITNSQSYRLRNACSYRSLDINGAAVDSNGAKIQIWDTNTSNAQEWVLTNHSSAPITDGTYNLITTSGKALAPVNENTGNGTRLVTGELHSAITEQFQFIRNADGSYRLRNIASGRHLDVSGASDSDGTTIQLWDPNDSCAQRWIIQNNQNGYRLISTCSNKSLDVYGGYIDSNDTKFEIWSSNNSAAQIFLLQSPMQNLIPDGIYQIESAINSELRIDTNGNLAAHDGSNIQTWNHNETNFQKYQITYDNSHGYYTIRNIASARSLDVSGGSTRLGANIQIWSDNSSCAQRWMVIPSSNNYYKILSACSRLALDVNGASTTPGTNIQLWSNNDSIAQKWSFRATNIDDNSSQILSDGIYQIQSGLNSQKFLDINGSSPVNNGSNAQLWERSYSDSQKFQLHYDQSGDYYTIYNLFSKRNLDVNGGGMFNGANIQVWGQNDSCAQKWYIKWQPDYYYNISSVCDQNYSLDVSGGNINNGANIQIWLKNNSPAQKWQFNH